MARFLLTAQLRLQAPSNVRSVVNNIRGQLQNITAQVNVAVPPQSQRQLNKVTKSTQKVQKAAKDASNSMTDFGKQAALAGKRFFAFTIATTAILKFTNAVKTGISEAISFQRELVKISQVTGTTLKNLSGLTKEIRRLSTTLGTSSTELLKASRILAQTGLAANEVQTALQALAKSDLAPTFDSITSTTEGAVAIFRQFGIEAKDLEANLGAINAVAGKFAVESGDIIAAVRRTGGAFAAAGGDLNELIALFTSVRATTRESAESIATGFRTIFTRLQRVRTQNFLESLGIDLRDAEEQFVGPLEAIRRLSTALKDLRGTDPRFAQIIEELGGFRQVSKVIPLIQQFETAEKALGVALSGTTSLSRDAQTAQQSLAVQIQKTREEFAAMIRQFTDNSSFKAIVTLALSMANAFIKVANTLEPLLPMLTVLAGIGIGRAIRPLLGGFRQAGGFGFASGGLVPGTGNKDTVPAKLTPGEYVIRKSAVQQIGVENLRNLNKGGSVEKFASGGQVIPKQNFGAIFMEPTTSKIQTEIRIKNIEDAAGKGFKSRGYISFEGDPNSKKYLKYDLVTGSLRKNQSQYIKKETEKGIENLTGSVGKAMLAPQNVEIVDSPIPNLKGITGSVFEGAISRLGAPIDDKAGMDDQRLFDFPSGLRGKSKEVFNNSKLGDVPVEAKKTLNDFTKRSIKQKIANFIADKVLSTGSYEGFKAEAGKKPTKKASGGAIDQVDALLTPGEYVIDKDTAARIGKKNLDLMNSGNISGMAYGGMFKPKLTTRGNAPGNVGRKKQFLAQRLEFLKRGKKQNVLNDRELQELLNLQSRLKNVQSSRTARFSKRLGFKKGGAVGRIKYASGGPVRMQGGGLLSGGGGGAGGLATISLATSAVASLTSQIDSLGSGFSKIVDTATSVGAQFGILFYTLRSVVDVFDTSNKTIEKQNQQLKTSIKERVALRKTIADPNTSDTDRQDAIQRKRAVTNEINATQDSIRTTKKWQVVANRTIQGVAALGAAATTVGKQLEEFGRKQLEAGGEEGAFVAGKTISGAGQGVQVGAALGATIGTAIAGPIGTAVGAAIGGSAGAITGGSVGFFGGRREAFNIKGLRDFNRGLGDIIDRLEDVDKGLVDFNTQLLSIQNFASGTLKRLSDVRTTPESRQDILASARGEIDKFNSFLTRAAKSSKTFAEFQEKAGKQTLRFAALLSDTPTFNLNKRFKDLIDINQELIEKQKKVIEIQDEYGNRIRNIVNVTRAFEDVSLTLKRFGSTIDTLISFAEGARSSFAVLDESSRLGTPEKFFDAKAFNEILERDIRNSDLLNFKFSEADLSTVGEDLSKDIEAAAQATRDLPGILLKLKNNITEFNAENALDKLVGEFEEAPKFVQNAIRLSAEKIIGGEGKEQKLIDKIQTDLLGAAEELGAGFKPVFEVATLVSSKMTEEANRRLVYIDRLVQLTNKEISIRNKSIDIAKTSEELLAKAFNRPVDLEKLAGFDLDRQKNILGDDAGLVNNPRAIGIKLQEEQNKILKIQNKITEEGIDIKGEDTEALRKSKETVSRLRQALDFLSDVTARTSTTLQKLEKEQAKGKFRTDLVDEVLSIERPEEARNLEGRLGATRFAAAAGTIDVVPPDLRSDVISLLKTIGDVDLGALGGATGNEVLKTLRSDLLQKAGFDKADADRIAAGFTSETEKLQAALVNVINTSSDAQNEILNSFKDASVRATEELSKSIKSFASEIKRIFESQQRKALVEERSELEGKKESGVAQIENLASLMRNFKVGGNVQEEDRLRLIAKQANEIQKVASDIKFREEAKKLQSVDRLLLDDSGPSGITPGVSNVPVGSVPISSDKTITDVEAAIKEQLTRVSEAVGNQEISSFFKDQLMQNVKLNEDGTIRYNDFADAVNKSIEATNRFTKERTDAIPTNIADLQRQFESVGGIDTSQISEIGSKIKDFGDQFKILNETKPVEELTKTLTDLRRAIEDKTREINSIGVPSRSSFPVPKTKQKGSFVHGTGSGDKVPALLEPGEFVLNRNAVKAVGVDKLNEVNQNYSRFQRGGLVKKKMDELEKLANRRKAQRIASGNYGKQNLIDKGIDIATGNADKVIDRIQNRRKAQRIASGNYGQESIIDKGIGFAGSLLSGVSFDTPTAKSAVPEIAKKPIKTTSTPSSTTTAPTTTSTTPMSTAKSPMPDMSLFNSVVEKFGNKVDLLANSLNSINGLSIELNARHTVEVLINGAAVLQNLMPSIQNLIVAETNKAINNMLKDKFPNVGPMD